MTYGRVKEPTEVVVIFKTHLRPGADEDAYRKVSRRMHELAATIPGFISIKGYTSEDGEEIDLVRFESERSLEAWRTHPEHREAQRRGREAIRQAREARFSAMYLETDDFNGPARRVYEKAGFREHNRLVRYKIAF